MREDKIIFSKAWQTHLLMLKTLGDMDRHVAQWFKSFYPLWNNLSLSSDLAPNFSSCAAHPGRQSMMVQAADPTQPPERWASTL